MYENQTRKLANKTFKFNLFQEKQGSCERNLNFWLSSSHHLPGDRLTTTMLRDAWGLLSPSLATTSPCHGGCDPIL